VRLGQWGNDADWGRPTRATAEGVWDLLKDHLPYALDDLLPKTSRAKKPYKLEELATVYLTAKQSLVVALDCAISTAGALGKKKRRDRTAMLTFNRVFAALAERWSIIYRDSAPAANIYDMVPEKIPTVYHELRCVVRIDTLLELVALPWEKIKAGTKNPLYRVRGTSKRRIRLRHSSAVLAAFDGSILADSQYRRRSARRILFAEDWTPQERPVRQRVCAGEPYNVVKLGWNSQRTLGHLEAARVRFDIDAFRADYRAVLRKPKKSRTPAEEGFLNAYRLVYLDTKAMSGVRRIRSRFFRAVNRRYHAANFWPEHVSKKFRERWFGVDTLVGAPIDGSADTPYVFVTGDISSSQTQILAAFLGLDDLEALARSTAPKFKIWLTQKLWALHEQRPGGLLVVGGDGGYRGPDDTRLIEFVKANWMRFLYGSPWKSIAKKLAQEPKKYGPGWKTTRGLDAKAVRAKKAGGPLLSGLQEAAIQAQTFFDSLPDWRIPLQTYLAACRSLQRTRGGVVFNDPWDGMTVRWNPAQRARTFIDVGKYKAEVHPWGLNTKQGFLNLPPGTIDTAELRTFTAPCLIHMLDALFSSLVIEGIHAAGIRDFVAIHDGWWVPETFLPLPLDEDEATPDICSGDDALLTAINLAGKPWLNLLGGIYEALEGYLGQDPLYVPFIRDMRTKWQTRLNSGKPPSFTTG
jgi:hypothetical protein